MGRGRPKGSTKKEKVEVKEEPKKIEEEELEIRKLRIITHLSEIQMLISTGQAIYQTKNVMDRILITEEEIYKLEFGVLIKMLKEYKLHRY